MAPINQNEVVRTAEDIIELLNACTSDFNGLARRIVANRLLAAIQPWLPPTAPPQSTPLLPMNEVESRQFGALRIPFGKYVGKRYDEVPADYLSWLADTQRESAKEITCYLKSQRVQRETENEENE